MQEAIQYAAYIVPSRAPPSRLFGPVRSVLYILIFMSYGFIFSKVIQKKIHRTFAIPFVINIIANASFTYIQFSLENYRLAVADILIVL